MRFTAQSLGAARRRRVRRGACDKTEIIEQLVRPSRRDERQRLNHVVMETGRVLDQLRGLRLADSVGRASYHHVLAARFRRELAAPGAEGVPDKVISVRRGG